MKKLLFLFIGLFLISGVFTTTDAQGVDGVYTKHLTAKRKPIPFQYIREADVMWSKVLTRRVNLTEKRNLSLYYPTVEMEGRKSLIQLMMWGIKNKSLTPFASDEFLTQFTLNEIDERFGAGVDTTYDIDPETGETIPLITKKPADISEVKELLIKERWIFDKQRSIMEARIIGLCPIRVYYRDDDLDHEEARVKKLFWVFFPEARNIFASEAIYNPKNQSQEMTFDDYFIKRMFEGYIFKESNVYDNRLIQDYATGLDVLLESERIKDEIFSFEHDLWEF
ncbi:MAG: gliding motility protein GldN [Bacteroidetes bacterium]|nr:MAG: gliding motility protein GldN [Bacteroidota bacterium]